MDVPLLKSDKRYFYHEGHEAHEEGKGRKRIEFSDYYSIWSREPVY
jgi:hypothetical protein